MNRMSLVFIWIGFNRPLSTFIAYSNSQNHNCSAEHKQGFRIQHKYIFNLLTNTFAHLFCHFGWRWEVEIGRAFWILTDTSALSLAQRGWAESSCRGYVNSVGSQDFADKLCQILTLSLGWRQFDVNRGRGVDVDTADMVCSLKKTAGRYCYWYFGVLKYIQGGQQMYSDQSANMQQAVLHSDTYTSWPALNLSYCDHSSIDNVKDQFNNDNNNVFEYWILNIMGQSLSIRLVFLKMSYTAYLFIILQK